MSDHKIKKEEMSTEQFVALMITFGIGVGAFIIYQKIDEIHYWYFKKFEIIWSSVFLFVSALIFGLSYWFLRKPLLEAKKRIDEISDFSSPEDETEVYTGKTIDGVPIYIPEKSRLSHVQIIGSTGRGKTESVILPWAIRDLEKDSSVVIIDGKGSLDIEERIKSHSDNIKEINLRCFDLNNIEKSAKINPLLRGSAEEIADRLFEALDFNESEYYKNVQYAGCSLAIEVLKASDKTVSFKAIHNLLTDEETFRDLTLSLSDDYEHLKVRVRDFLSTTAQKRKEQFSGLLAQIAPFAVGSLSEILNAEVDECSISKLLTTKKEVIKSNFNESDEVDDEEYKSNEEEKKKYKPTALIFSLPTLKYQNQASRIGKLILQELAWGISERESKGIKDFTPVFLDEFSSFVYPGFINILNKARSSGVALHLSHQSIGDLKKVSDDFATSLNTNTNVKCILGLNDPDTADFFARHIGTKEKVRYTKRVRERGLFRSDFEDTGDASMRDTESYKIHPNRLKNLGIGQGVLHIPRKRGEAFSEVIDFKAHSWDERKLESGFDPWGLIIGY